jgi:hypothetical protein
MPNPPHLAPQQRPRAVAELERVIAGAKATRDQAQQVVNGLAGPDRRRAEAYLRIAEDRLAQLHRSREVLIGGEQLGDAEAETW